MSRETGTQRTRLVIATSNSGKLRELSGFLPQSIELISLAELGLPSPQETGRSFLDNAILKAEYASHHAGQAALADDSGLEVDVLSGRPGIYSARFAGPGSTDDENNQRLIRELRSHSHQPWTARFVCAVAMSEPGWEPLTAVGCLHGRIVEHPRGSGGFGYDPHFEIDDHDGGDMNGKTLAELTPSCKNALSHRRRAYDALVVRARETTGGGSVVRQLVEQY